MRLSLLRIVALAGMLLLGISVPTALAQPSSPVTGPPSPERPAGPQLGILPPRPAQPHAAAHRSSGGNNLFYHNGPVMLSNQVYAIYWFPSGSQYSANYQNLINGFFQNVATAGGSGATNNVYYSDTQYYSNVGSIAYNSAFVQSVVDTTPYPANGCTDSYTSVCLSDAQLRTEVVNVIQANHWTAGASSVFFIFTPKGVGSCYSVGSCAFSQYCAYHSNTTLADNVTAVYWANMPYSDTVPAACDAGQHPNGDDADATINVTSHEHNEAITDPLGTAWYDLRGYENGDKCAWNFGTALGGGSGAQYNQAINGSRYYLQQEWSNQSSRCVLTGK